MENVTRELNWIPIVELAVLAVTSLGVTISLFVHSDNNFNKSMTAMREERTAMLEGMRSDMLTYHRENAELMRDFHGRLCAIEERNKTK